MPRSTPGQPTVLFGGRGRLGRRAMPGPGRRVLHGNAVIGGGRCGPGGGRTGRRVLPLSTRPLPAQHPRARGAPGRPGRGVAPLRHGLEHVRVAGVTCRHTRDRRRHPSHPGVNPAPRFRRGDASRLRAVVDHLGGLREQLVEPLGDSRTGRPAALRRRNLTFAANRKPLRHEEPHPLKCRNGLRTHMGAGDVRPPPHAHDSGPVGAKPRLPALPVQRGEAAEDGRESDAEGRVRGGDGHHDRRERAGRGIRGHGVQGAAPSEFSERGERTMENLRIGAEPMSGGREA
ncbi:hypothetical protein EES45_00585 [Streptomyces sp. ADI97-07]|nr:hypothetical protein EES45_00585 [Streptomyces sp. ADI97-07]